MNLLCQIVNMLVYSETSLYFIFNIFFELTYFFFKYVVLGTTAKGISQIN